MKDKSLGHLRAIKENVQRKWGELWYPKTEADKLLEELGTDYVLNWFQTVSALPEGGIGIHGQSRQAEDPMKPHDLWWQQIGHPVDHLAKRFEICDSLPADSPDKSRFAQLLLKKLEHTIEYAAISMNGGDGHSGRIIVFKNPGVTGTPTKHYGIDSHYFTWAHEGRDIPIEDRLLDEFQYGPTRRTNGETSQQFSQRVLRTLLMKDLSN